MDLLTIIIIALGIIAIAQLVRVYELTAKLRNKREEHISHRDNKMNASLMLVFMAALYIMFIYLVALYGGGGLPESASEHGVLLDNLFDFNWAILLSVFFLTNTLLFYFAYKYCYSPDRRALFYPHNNKLELIWTVIPAIVLAVIIIYGLTTWNEITSMPEPGAVTEGEEGSNTEYIELYSKQFEWIGRYSGEDMVLGDADYKLVTGTNPVGVITTETLNSRIDEFQQRIAAIDSTLNRIHAYEAGKISLEDVTSGDILPFHKETELKEEEQRLQTLKQRLEILRGDTVPRTYGYDDKIVRNELHLVKGREYIFQFRSQDVIHSAYFPHFRAQMNTVPGMITSFRFTPTITTAEMREKEGDPDFDYVLLCNKICGAAHYNMQMKIIVETEEEFNRWYKEQADFTTSMAAGDGDEETVEDAVEQVEVSVEESGDKVAGQEDASGTE